MQKNDRIFFKTTILLYVCTHLCIVMFGNSIFIYICVDNCRIFNTYAYSCPYIFFCTMYSLPYTSSHLIQFVVIRTFIYTHIFYVYIHT